MWFSEHESSNKEVVQQAGLSDGVLLLVVQGLDGRRQEDRLMSQFRSLEGQYRLDVGLSVRACQALCLRGLDHGLCPFLN